MQLFCLDGKLNHVEMTSLVFPFIIRITYKLSEYPLSLTIEQYSDDSTQRDITRLGLLS